MTRKLHSMVMFLLQNIEAERGPRIVKSWYGNCPSLEGRWARIPIRSLPSQRYRAVSIMQNISYKLNPRECEVTEELREW